MLTVPIFISAAAVRVAAIAARISIFFIFNLSLHSSF